MRVVRANALGCVCNLPNDLSMMKYFCPECMTRYTRNRTVYRWYVHWQPEDGVEMAIAKLPTHVRAAMTWAGITDRYQSAGRPSPVTSHRPVTVPDVVIGGPPNELIEAQGQDADGAYVELMAVEHIADAGDGYPSIKLTPIDSEQKD